MTPIASLLGSPHISFIFAPRAALKAPSLYAPLAAAPGKSLPPAAPYLITLPGVPAAPPGPTRDTRGTAYALCMTTLTPVAVPGLNLFYRRLFLGALFPGDANSSPHPLWDLASLPGLDRIPVIHRHFTYR